MKVITRIDPLERIRKMVLDAVQSENTRRAYKAALRDFMLWYANSGEQKLSKRIIRAYIAYLRNIGISAQSINIRLADIKKLCTEAADNQVLSPTIAAAISRVERIKCEGVRMGHWLSKEEVQTILNRPPRNIKDLRDRAVLSVLFGAGLRRSECATLKFENIQLVNARWVLVNITGKGNKTRSVPIAAWTKLAIDQWAEAASISDGFVFRALRRGGHVTINSMGSQAIYDMLVDWGIPCAPHDARRTMAQLAHLGGCAIEQIQITLGHSSIKTTERYLGVKQNIVDAPADHLGLSFISI
jgi:site-specific recombinase XerD